MTNDARKICPLMLLLLANPLAADWLTLPSTYTHDPNTGVRTMQYEQPAPSYTYGSPAYRTSGFRQYRSSIQYGQAADNYHRVERWGEPVRPYGEWRFPVRPYSTPYPAWGAPYAGLRGFGFPGFLPATGPPSTTPPSTTTTPTTPFGPGGASLTPYPHIPGSPYPVPPYFDGYHPNYGEIPRLPDADYYFKPKQ